jgi:hypothetical protein
MDVIAYDSQGPNGERETAVAVNHGLLVSDREYRRRVRFEIFRILQDTPGIEVRVHGFHDAADPERPDRGCAHCAIWDWDTTVGVVICAELAKDGNPMIKEDLDTGEQISYTPAGCGRERLGRSTPFRFTPDPPVCGDVIVKERFRNP